MWCHNMSAVAQHLENWAQISCHSYFQTVPRSLKRYPFPVPVIQGNEKSDARRAARQTFHITLAWPRCFSWPHSGALGLLLPDPRELSMSSLPSKEEKRVSQERDFALLFLSRHFYSGHYRPNYEAAPEYLFHSFKALLGEFIPRAPQTIYSHRHHLYQDVMNLSSICVWPLSPRESISKSGIWYFLELQAVSNQWSPLEPPLRPYL